MKILKNSGAWNGQERRNPGRINIFRIGKIRKFFNISNLRKRLLIYFALVVFVTFSVGAQLLYEVGSRRLNNQIAASVVDQLSEHEKDRFDIAKVSDVLKKLQYRMILIMAIVMICVIVTMLVFTRNIIEPLDLIGKAAKKIADGHLDETVPVRNQDEIGNIGELINDLAANLQEILLHVWNHTGDDIVLLDHICEEVNAGQDNGLSKKVKQELAFVRQDIEDMQNMVKAFDYYNIRLDNGRVIADEEDKTPKGDAA